MVYSLHVTFEQDCVLVKNGIGEILLNGTKSDGLFHVSLYPDEGYAYYGCNAMDLWHKRYGHLGKDNLLKL